MSPAIGVGIIGYGFMGRTHADGYRAAGPGVELRAIAGRRGSGKGRESGWEDDVVWADDPELVLQRDDLAAVSICTYTDSHIALARRALEQGKHVLIEKPVALRSAEVALLVESARKSGLVCMPAMCMRFWPGWPWLRERIHAGTFGAVRRAEFTRLAAAPNWGVEFYHDLDRSGGALFDLHVHDVDFLRWCLGDPSEVHSRGAPLEVTTTYFYGNDTPDVMARGAWLPDPVAPFTMRYEVDFEEVRTRFDLASTPHLRVQHHGAWAEVPLSDRSAYHAEVAHFLDLVSGRVEVPVAPLDDALAVARILEAESESLRLGHRVAPHPAGR